MTALIPTAGSASEINIGLCSEIVTAQEALCDNLFNRQFLMFVLFSVLFLY
jgi:hypothetical protein